MRDVERRFRVAVATVAGLTALAFAALALARYRTLHHHTFDLALYTRMAWGLAHGEFWEPVVGGSFLGGHRPLVLLPLGLLGRALDTATVLLCAQAAAFSLAAWPLARFARRKLGPGGALCAVAAWLLYPNLGHVATYEFHPGSLAVLPLCLGLEALDRQAPRGLLAGGLLAMACRSALALETAAMALLALRRGLPLRTTGIVLLAASLGYFALGVLWLTPAFGAAAGSSLDLHFGHFGGSPWGVIATLAREPTSVLAHFGRLERLTYPLRVLAPLAFLPLLAPRWLLPALPALAFNLLSAFPTTLELYSHYLTPALPALFFAAIEGAARARGLPVALVASALAGSVVAGGMPWSRGYVAADFRQDERTRQRSAALAAVPPGASVQAPDPLLPHLAERRTVHRSPPPERQTRFVVLDIAHRQRFARSEDLLRTREEPLVRRWLARPDHGLVHASDGYLVLERGRPPRRGLVRRYFVDGADVEPPRALCACLALSAAHVREAAADEAPAAPGAGVLELLLVARSACPEDLALRLGAGDRPGRVDLLFDGLLSPAHLRGGDRLRSLHSLSARELRAMERHGLYVGALRSSGARPAPGDPHALAARVQRRTGG